MDSNAMSVAFFLFSIDDRRLIYRDMRLDATERILRPCLVSKNFQDSPSHRILRHMHRALNAVEKITNYTVQLEMTR